MSIFCSWTQKHLPCAPVSRCADCAISTSSTQSRSGYDFAIHFSRTSLVTSSTNVTNFPKRNVVERFIAPTALIAYLFGHRKQILNHEYMKIFFSGSFEFCRYSEISKGFRANEKQKLECLYLRIVSFLLRVSSFVLGHLKVGLVG